jgi:TolA-binding protein
VKTKLIPALLLLLLLGALSARGTIQRSRLPDFAIYLKEAGLTKLYRTEIRTQCIEYRDDIACIEGARILTRERERIWDAALLDSITHSDKRTKFSRDLFRARYLVAVEDYDNALSIVEPIIEAMPAKDLMVEAVLVRAQCRYHLGRTDEALMNLRAIRPFVPEGRDPTLPLYLGLCEEARGNLEDAQRLLEEAEAGGLPDAALALLRVAIKQGDLDHFRVVADEIGADGMGLDYGDVCGLAGEVGEVLPGAWQSLMEPVIADSEFTVETCPEVVGSLVRLAEDGEDVSGYCRTLLARGASDEDADRLRYARAISGEDTARCDTLALLSRTASSRDLKIRCLTGCLTYAGDEERAVFAGRLLPMLSGFYAELDPVEEKEIAELLIESGEAEAGRERLLRLAEDLKVGYDDAAMLEVARAVERSGVSGEAVSLYRKISESPLPSEQTLAARRAAYTLEKTGKPDEDVAGVVERVAEEGISPLELGDLFMDRLKDFDRAASFYRRAVNDPPEGVGPDHVKMRLAEALAVGFLETGDRDLRSEAIGLLSGLADTNTVDAGEVLRVLQVSTGWLAEDRGRAFTVLQKLGRRQDLGSSDLYQAARLLYRLFSERDGNVYAQCAVTLRRLADEYPTSREAPLGAFLAARLKFAAGDYVEALEAYEECLQVWRNHVVTGLCQEGIGDCYLYSGGFEQALDHYGGVDPCPRIALKIGECQELSDRPDSAMRYYDLALRRVSPSALSSMIRFRRAILTLEERTANAVPPVLDSPAPRLREALGPFRRMAAAYALARAGYRAVGMEVLERATRSGDDAACEALLLLSNLESDGEPDGRPARLGEGESVCRSIYGALRLLHERAYLACSSGPLDACVKERRRYQQRFPLDRDARLGFGVHQALILYREGLPDSANAIIDSLARNGRKHDALAYGLYRKGIHHMVEGDHAAALMAFARVEEGYPNSDLYFDTLLKLGTAYYMLEKYDSSAAYFENAAGAEEASIAENACFNLGLALEEAGRLEEASAAFRRLAIRFPFSERFDRSLMRCAYTLQQAGRPDEAIDVYRDLIQYAEAPDTAAEAMYWIGESFAEMGEPARAACEFLRVVHLFPDGGPWAGTAAFRAGMECERAGLIDHALIVYRENVRRFGTGTDWGRASGERIDELSKPQPARQEAPGPLPEAPGE